MIRLIRKELNHLKMILSKCEQCKFSWLSRGDYFYTANCKDIFQKTIDNPTSGIAGNAINCNNNKPVFIDTDEMCFVNTIRT